MVKVKKLLARRELEEGNKVPWGYGLSYWRYESLTAVCYPILLHLIVRWCRDLWFWIVKAGFPGTRSQWEQEIVRQTEKRFRDSLAWPPGKGGR